MRNYLKKPVALVLSMASLAGYNTVTAMDTQKESKSCENYQKFGPQLNQNPIEVEIQRLMPKNPKFSPLATLRLIKDYLIPTYTGQGLNIFKTKIDCSTEEGQEVLAFMMANQENILKCADPTFMLITLRFMTQKFDYQSIFNGYHQNMNMLAGNHYPYHDMIYNNNKVMFYNCGGVHKSLLSEDEMFMAVDVFYQSLINTIEHMPIVGGVQGNQIAQSPEEIKDNLKKAATVEINKFFYVNGSNDLNIIQHTDIINDLIPTYLKTLRQLSKYALGLHKSKGIDLLNLRISHAEASIHENKDQGHAPVSVSMQQPFDTAEFKQNEKYMPILERVIDWIDGVFVALSKQGRVS